MRGALTSIISLTTILWIGGNAVAQNALEADKGPLSLEKSFEVAKQEVQNQLLNAPEASYIYLTHWINIYNQSKSAEDIFSFERKIDPSPAPTRDYAIPKKQTRWKPNGFPIVSPEWRYLAPISFSPASRFRPKPPPDIESVEFQQDAKDVLKYGDDYSLTRRADEALASAFWANGPGTETPPGRWNIIALESSKSLPRAQRTALMLRLNIALYDAGIAAFDAKYHYDYWRPQTAIRHLYPEQADWGPMMQPPFHPEYVSGHSAFSGAAAAILEHYLGRKNFCITAPELHDLERCFTSFNEAAQEAGRSRIFGGIHFEFSNQAGLKLGRDVAEQVISNIDLSED